ncbi:Probable RNA-directed DNA polymerase from transposon X-element [Eumeta japonica]|uniref:Probable RNA-directed DNA polymerase from transposon X-element n=1 Tax=Eumeta variegata TaxID=151549 RepID=A0A4C1SFJ9_EUMVA|nr:Probable RNA-directed DNA polymerase from transposon X-element [Eumeta japonica]
MVMECSRKLQQRVPCQKIHNKRGQKSNTKANTKKSPGYDLITNKILKELPNSGVRLMTEIYNAMTKLQFIPPQWKVAQIIMLLKPGKQPEDPKSYRPISLLPIPSKIYESLLLLRILPLVEQHKIIPDHQFGFRRKHATVDQIHRLINEIDKSLNPKSTARVYFLTYLRRLTESPTGSVLGPLLYLIYTSDLPTSDCITTGTFADDTAILASHQDPAEASKILQDGLNNILNWLKRWRIKVNESKSVSVIFTLKKGICPRLKINNIEIPKQTTRDT